MRKSPRSTSRGCSRSLREVKADHLPTSSSSMLDDDDSSMSLHLIARNIYRSANWQWCVSGETPNRYSIASASKKQFDIVDAHATSVDKMKATAQQVLPIHVSREIQIVVISGIDDIADAPTGEAGTDVGQCGVETVFRSSAIQACARMNCCAGISSPRPNGARFWRHH